jgi:hypothetical protein
MNGNLGRGSVRWCFIDATQIKLKANSIHKIGLLRAYELGERDEKFKLLSAAHCCVSDENCNFLRLQHRPWL